jgi:UDP-N-acetylmuramoylalanine--D-glutamate ligase
LALQSATKQRRTPEEPEVGLRTVERSFEEAVAEARKMAEPGDILLLSPACSSFDMFENYEARGRRFAALCREKG